MRIYVTVLILLLSHLSAQGNSEKHRLYLLAGQGGDARLFAQLDLTQYDTSFIPLPVPYADETLEAYALRLSAAIDTTQPYSLMGVSLGGMVCSELAQILNPEHTFLISSAAVAADLPKRYACFKHIPLYRWLGGKNMIRMANWGRRWFEPTGPEHEEVFRSMLSAKDPVYMERATNMVVHWENDTRAASIVRIHGTKDHTIPPKKKPIDHRIEGGSHMVVVTHADEVLKIIQAYLEPTT